MLNFILMLDNDTIMHYTRTSFTKAFRDAKAFLASEAEWTWDGKEPITYGDLYVTSVTPDKELTEAVKHKRFVKRLYSHQFTI